MRASSLLVALGCIVLMLGMAIPAAAQQVLLEWGPDCFGWEPGYEGHISQPGAELTILGKIDAFYGALGFLDPDVNEYTFVFDGLVSQGTEVVGGIIFETDYTGGSFRIYEDTTPDYEFGIDPPNGTAPSTFIDGELILEGTLSDFHVFLIDDGSPPGAVGTVTASWLLTGGSLFDILPDCSGPILGNWTDDPNVVPIPQGYTSHTDGKYDLGDCPPTATDTKTWGNVKTLYR